MIVDLGGRVRFSNRPTACHAGRVTGVAPVLFCLLQSMNWTLPFNDVSLKSSCIATPCYRH